MKIAVMVFAVISLTSCRSNLYDWEYIPETQIVHIPQEGGIYHFMGFEREKVGVTRAVDIENDIYKCYRYRINLGDNIGESVHYDYIPLKFEVPSNESDTERDVVLEISKAKEFHLSDDGKYLDSGVCDKADASEEYWDEWQIVWRGVQAGSRTNSGSSVSYTEYTLDTCDWDFSWGSVKEEGDVIVVNSDKELSNLITHFVCEEDCGYSGVDFTKHSLVVAYGGCRNGIYSINITNFVQTSATELALHIAITTNMTDEAPVWIKALIVDKLSEQSSIKLDVNIK